MTELRVGSGSVWGYVVRHADLLMAVGMTLIVWGAVVQRIGQERSLALDGARSDTANLARAFEQNTIRSIEAIDLVLFLTRDLYERDPSGFQFPVWVKQYSTDSALAFQISVIDRMGMLRRSTLDPTNTPVDLSDREHFRVHTQGRGDFLFVSRPLLGRVSQKWSVQLTRPIFDARGAFDGVVVASVDPYYLARFYGSIDVGPHGVIGLIGQDGLLRAMVPSMPGGFDRPALTGSPVVAAIGQPRTGTMLLDGPLDDVPRVVSFHGVGTYPLAIFVGVAVADAMEPATRARTFYVSVGAGLTGFIVLVAMLSGRYRSQLLGTRRLLAVALENMNRGILMVDAHDRVRVSNREMAQIMNVPTEALRSKPLLRELVAKLPVDDVPQGGLVPRDGGAQREWVRAGGQVVEISISALEDGGAVATYTDITERKANERALSAARDAAEAANRARAGFFAMMSHEIRTPMNAVIGFAGLLLDSRLTVEQGRFARGIRDAAEGLLQIIDDILDVSKLEAGRLSFEAVPFELDPLLDSVVSVMQLKAREKGLSLSVNVAPGTPPALVGDPGRLRQVLLNLVANAIKFTATGAVRVEVGLVERVDGKARLRFAVVDTGIGIAPEAQQLLFKEFSQVDSTIARRFGGTGLGLAICRRLVERMGGTIEVVSEAGAGSRFQFDVRMAETAPGERMQGLKEEAGGPPERRLRVLLAEDNASNRLVAMTRLERMGHRVDAVGNGAEAVAAVQMAPYDVVLMDVMMPEMDGMEAARAIRSLDGPVREIPIVALTANAFRSDEEACREAGMDGFISKPMATERLLAVLNDVIHHRMRAGAPVSETEGVTGVRAG